MSQSTVEVPGAHGDHRAFPRRRRNGPRSVSNDTLLTLQALGLRAYLVEPDRGRRCWRDAPEAQGPVYGNRRRVNGARGRQLMRRRGEYVERTFAHVYDTGGLRRLHLRGHPNILKRLIVHAGAFNLGLLMRQVMGRGTPGGLQGRRRPGVVLWRLLASLVAELRAAVTSRIELRQSQPRIGQTYFPAVAACSR